jgi:hypothetical protein
MSEEIQSATREHRAVETRPDANGFRENRALQVEAGTYRASNLWIRSM